MPNPVRAILGGQQGSILDVYGKGEYEWDNWVVKLYVNRGNDNGVSIRYGVNLTDLTHDIDTSGVYTAVVPFWKSSEGDIVVTLDGGYVKVSSVPVLVNWTDNNDNAITDNNGTVIEFNAEDSGTHIKSTTMDLSEAFSYYILNRRDAEYEHKKNHCRYTFSCDNYCFMCGICQSFS